MKSNLSHICVCSHVKLIKSFKVTCSAHPSRTRCRALHAHAAAAVRLGVDVGVDLGEGP